MINLFTELFSWRSILDIALITLVAFFVYVTLRRLGTWKILLGVLLAFGLYFIAKALDLSGIIWFYSNVSQVAVIGFIVLFQPEIRKLFESAVSPRRRDSGQKDKTLAGLISEAADIMAQKKQGALIVLPGKESVDGYLAGGQVLTAEISLPLILSIFDPHSPGHDGAVIVENGKITRFGVRLPISASENLPKDYGTRHYAAAGLSDATDALVIAVSEERGTITVFKQGKGEVQKTSIQLANTIDKHWQDTRSFLAPIDKSRRRSLWLEIIASFLIACALWYSVVVGEAEIREKVVTIPIEYIRTPKDLALTGETPSAVKVRLVGPKSSLINIDDFRVKVDLSKAIPGRQRVTITANHINLAKKVKLVDAQPSSLALELVQIIQAELIVKPQWIGKLQPSLRIVTVNINPAKIKARVRSDNSDNKNLVLMTTPIYLENIKASTTIYSKIVAPPRIQPADEKWPDVEVFIKVDKRRTSGAVN